MVGGDDKTIDARGTSAPGSPHEDLPAGTQVGEYVVEHKLGEGGFGAVYRASHPLIGKSAAVKILHRAFSADADMVSRFVAEARAVNQIRHRNIIDVFAFGQLPDGRQYYIMELLDGEPFDRRLEGGRTLSLSAALPIFRGIARALDAAHRAGVVHRDLKPENVFLVNDDDGPFPKLLDFGIAKLMPGGKADSHPEHKTRTGVQMGTPYYMSPEQCRGVGVDHRTDLYALGVMAHRVLTGAMPFDGQTSMDVMMKHISAEPPKVSAFGLPPELDAPIARMLAKDPDARPATATEAIDALLAVAGTLPGDPKVTTAPMAIAPGALEPKGTTDLGMAASLPTTTSSKRLWVGVGAAALVAVAGAAFLLRPAAHEQPIAPTAAASAPPASASPAAPPPVASPAPTPSSPPDAGAPATSASSAKPSPGKPAPHPAASLHKDLDQAF